MNANGAVKFPTTMGELGERDRSNFEVARGYQVTQTFFKKGRKAYDGALGGKSISEREIGTRVNNCRGVRVRIQVSD